MAKISLSGGYKPIDEGYHIFRIKTVEYKEDFGKLHMVLETSDGKTLFNDFNFGASGENQKAINAFSFFARTVIGNAALEEVDPEELVGKYVRGEVIHTEGTQLDANGNAKIFANGRNWEYADGFEGTEKKVNLDDILDM